ncbi:DUF6879 family protein [Streptomyces sp. DT20]|uniref:DUF6879 family protein n=1 Tax=Streptomyces sp. DT20 TaxID=3416519 RepID=UPI003CEB3704
MLSPQADGPGQRLGLDDYAEDFGRHFPLHRVRCVEEPISPYLQWELHLLGPLPRTGA